MLRVPGVGKVEAVVAGWNEIVLYVAPAGAVTEPSDLLSETARLSRTATHGDDLVAHRRAAGRRHLLHATVNAQPNYYAVDVQRAVEAAVAPHLDFHAVTFAQQIDLSKVYDLIQSLPQVASLNVTEFSRAPDGTTCRTA